MACLTSRPQNTFLVRRYNLKRKIAELPPVTKEWFDSRKDQLTSTATLAAQVSYLF